MSSVHLPHPHPDSTPLTLPSPRESATSNQQTTSTVTVSQKDGQTCQLDVRVYSILPHYPNLTSTQFETKSCTTKGSGSLPFLASGWVWFVYKNKTKDHWNCQSFFLTCPSPY